MDATLGEIALQKASMRKTSKIKNLKELLKN
jgi:hypothetical protein